ncbi:MAG TPA: hypothetical protein VGO07_02410 [Candidatus Saccharimonadales bacterium]|nr:hypothetical protein [Candidatus Saccharimonadales bacterium]
MAFTESLVNGSSLSTGSLAGEARADIWAAQADAAHIEAFRAERAQADAEAAGEIVMAEAAVVAADLAAAKGEAFII